ncbi:prepilin-type N-terminal cleavage/methylation domain-containing protein [Thiothrix lacustris]|jgi:type IV pilus assembly protein PilW|uniref:Prepilin-type N-terminal cleavage/methylation domain-containing protein n=1 Tax=Thiothrix lacustris TaxID=525917 RepID=A0ABY9MQZ0_9GAMM|nr:prepilin-type N-terminal cleavage/methylation domain-containing protein [Thiothrix lacustris]WML91073.1 prepilin-type N-terminal cleavage/methylation domain-containing protein [Thiothrix lacustris]
MKQRGFNLVELMISMLLGVILMGGIISIFSATRQVYRSNAGLAQLQESARMTFEMLSRDLRQAGADPCGNGGRIANVLNDRTNRPLLNWNGFQGFDPLETTIPGVTTGNEVGQRVAGSSAILLQSMVGTEYPLEEHKSATTTMVIDSTATNVVKDDILLVCDIQQTSLFQVSNLLVIGGKTWIMHNNDSNSPGNCSKGLGFPTNCATTQGNPYTYPPNAYIGRLYSSVWYLGNNGRTQEGGRSLYRARIDKGNTLYEEIVSGLNNLRIEYHVSDVDTWSDASAITDWDTVDALKLTITFITADTRLSTDSSGDGRLQRTITNIVALRNHL